MRLFRTIFFSLCFTVLFTDFAHTVDAVPATGEQLVTSGNQFYQLGDFSNAELAYQSALDTGTINGHLYYNLANAQSRLGKLGKAIANYRRAKLHLPRDPDIEANLELVRKRAIDRIADPSANSLFDSRRLLVARSYFSNAEMQQTALVLYSICWILFALSGYFSVAAATQTLYGFVVLTVLSFILTFCTAQTWDGSYTFSCSPFTKSSAPAVIAAEEVKLYSGNSESFQVVFVLHDGAEVQVEELRDAWAEVKLPGGRRGWTKRETLEFIEANSL